MSTKRPLIKELWVVEIHVADEVHFRVMGEKADAQEYVASVQSAATDPDTQLVAWDLMAQV